jgi:hypothetical protein
MKNSFKIGALAMVIAVSFAACKGKSGNGSSDSDTSKKVDTTVVKVDTSKKADTSKKVAVDTAKKDTSKKK